MNYEAYLRSPTTSSDRLNLRGMRRIALLLIVALCLPVVAGAYTLVMRTGRHIVVSNRFVLSRDLLTYEASPGINVSVHVSHIDVTATERINGEGPGSFLKRTSVKIDSDANPRGEQKKRTLTNGDLETSKRARQKSERAYEERRVELGLPRLEKPRQSAAEQEQSLRDALIESADDRQAEIYWRTRASELRTDILALDGQINFLRTRILEINANSGLRAYSFVSSAGGLFASPGGFSIVAPSFGLPVGNNPFNRGPVNSILPGGTPVNTGLMRGTSVTAVSAPQFGARINFGGNGTRGIIGFHRGHPYPYRRHANYAPAFVYAAPNNYEYGALTLQLQELETARAGLHARWRALEEEARRAGAPPGWLRP